MLNKTPVIIPSPDNIIFHDSKNENNLRSDHSDNKMQSQFMPFDENNDNPSKFGYRSITSNDNFSQENDRPHHDLLPPGLDNNNEKCVDKSNYNSEKNEKNLPPGFNNENNDKSNIN